MSEHDEQLRNFASMILDSGIVWGLKGQEGWAVCDSIEFEDTEVLPFFASKDEAVRLCIDEWSSYEPQSMPIEEFLEDWLPGMHEDNAMVGLQWNSEMEGPEVEPADIARSLGNLENPTGA